MKACGQTKYHSTSQGPALHVHAEENVALKKLPETSATCNQPPSGHKKSNMSCKVVQH